MTYRRRAPLLAACACLIAAGRVHAQGVCWVPADAGFTPVDAPPLDKSLVFKAGFAAEQDDGSIEFTGRFELSYQGAELTAENARVSADGRSLSAIGGVTVRNEAFSVHAEDAEVDRANETVNISRGEFDLLEQPAHGSASDILITADQRLILNDLSFTTCPEDNVDWLLKGRRLEIDKDQGFAKARGVTLRLGRVPVMRLPVLSFPIDSRRKSGFLTPKMAERDRTGFDLTVPYYLNLAPNYDLLLEPRYMSDRGTQIGSRFRYLLPRSEGHLDLAHMQNDRRLDRSRYLVDFGHDAAFSPRWELTTRIENVSDSAYFEDLGDSLGVISQTHLDRYVDLSRYGQRWSLVTRLKDYQTIDPLISEADRPYRRLPQVAFDGRWGDGLVGFDSAAESVRFERNVGVTGWRFDTMQELSLRFGRSGAYLTPAVGFRQTNYRVDATGTGPAYSLSRGLPITSLDSGLRFERGVGADGSWTQTIEPRALYVRIPYEDQSELPVFDTIIPDFNLVQLFSKYQYVGPDRIADTNQISVGLTTRLLGPLGRERVSATIGQTRYRSPRRVMLPGEAATESTRSNYVAELAINLNPNWNVNVGYQRNGETKRVVRAETRFEFRPRDDRLLGVGYRLREGVLEQSDISMIWPVGDRWRLISQYSYSLLEKKALEQLAGLEYEACCWRVRFTTQRYIVRSTGETDTSVALQLELKGLSQQRASAAELLGRGILGGGSIDQFFE